MPYYEWRGSGVFRDAANNREISTGDVVELDKRAVGNHDFKEVDEPAQPDDADAEVSNEEAASDYESMSYDELRQLAADADTDEVNGRSSKDEILAYFT